MFLKWANPDLFLFIFVFSTLHNSKNGWKANPLSYGGTHNQSYKPFVIVNIVVTRKSLIPSPFMLFPHS